MKAVFKASAPGRLDVMGGIADYSGSLVLQKPVSIQTHVELTLRSDYHCTIRSTLHNNEVLQFAGDCRSYLKNDLVDYSFAQQVFKQNKNSTWAAYILGCALVLQKEKGIEFTGADIELHSEVPNGKGVASSASVEIATMKALGLAFDVSFSGTELPILAQRVENLVVGAPCGLMDQLASWYGKPDALLPIVCQPDLVQSAIEIPRDIFVAGIDSGIRHQVAGASYSDVRCAAFMGYSIIVKSLGLTNTDLRNAVQQNLIASLPFKGYLSNISVQEFEARFEKLLPDKLKGKDFLELYGGTIDPITHVDENKIYSVKNCTSHPVYENLRVHAFMEHLIALNREPHPAGRGELTQRMGKLMQASHASYTQCGLGTARTDEICSLALSKDGIFGARITGGGNGGTVGLLAYGDKGHDAVKNLHKTVCERYGEKLELFF